MEVEELRKISNEKMFPIFLSFMARITKFEELVDVGSQLLVGFHQGLEFIRRPPIDMSIELVERIVKANMTRMLSSYVEAGCVNTIDVKQTVSKLYTCHLGLLEHVNKAGSVVKELECLLDDAAAVVQATNENLPYLQHKDVDFDLNSYAETCNKERLLSYDLQIYEIIDYAILMAFIYGMVKQDYKMQERIISSLSLKSSSGELESYCLMWSLRPFVDEEIMHKAWRFIP